MYKILCFLNIMVLTTHLPNGKAWFSNEATIVDKSNEILRPPLPSHFNDGKMARFALRANSSLILGGGGGGNFLFYSVQDCSITGIKTSFTVFTANNITAY